ncbi:MAG: hypothetical protein ACOH2T_19135 [Pseudomonas sp.]
MDKFFTPQLPVMYHDCSSHYRRLVREEYSRIQGGNCQHCLAPLSGPPADHVAKAHINLRLFPPGMLDHPVHLHHDRKTGLTIGAVHARCNAFLFQYHGV